MNGKENKNEKNKKEFEHFRIAKREKENIVHFDRPTHKRWKTKPISWNWENVRLFIRICVWSTSVNSIGADAYYSWKFFVYEPRNRRWNINLESNAHLNWIEKMQRWNIENAKHQLLFIEPQHFKHSMWNLDLSKRIIIWLYNAMFVGAENWVGKISVTQVDHRSLWNGREKTSKAIIIENLRTSFSSTEFLLEMWWSMFSAWQNYFWSHATVDCSGSHNVCFLLCIYA